MAANSAEYRTLKKHTVDLRLAVKSDLVGLGGTLFASDLITKVDCDNLTNQSISKDNHAAKVVGLIQDKVEQDPRNYHTFISALEKDSSHYNAILQTLNKTYSGKFSFTNT